MRKFFSAVLLYLLIPLLALFIIFLFWGSAGQLRRSQLSQIKNYQYAGVSKRDTLKIMSYNIGYLSGMFNNRPVEVNPELFKANLHKSAELLSKHNPDFIAFQEIDFDADRSGNVHQLDSLAQLANYPYAAIAINWDKNYVLFPYGRPAVHFGQMLSGQAILSKFPVVNQTRIVLPKPEGNYFYNKFYIDRLIQIVQVDVGHCHPVADGRGGLGLAFEQFLEQVRLDGLVDHSQALGMIQRPRVQVVHVPGGQMQLGWLAG